MQVFTKFVQVGRVVVINAGKDKTKMAVVVDILDHNRVMVEGPTTGVARQIISVKRIDLTDIMVEKMPRGCRSPTVKKCIEASGVVAAFAATPEGVAIAKDALRAKVTDFDRHLIKLALRKVRPHPPGAGARLSAAASQDVPRPGGMRTTGRGSD